MSLITISEISKDYGISTRTLRYYEEIGLLPSRRSNDYAYRAYDQAAANRLRQILVLKKLRIPLKQIRKIFENESLSDLTAAFEEKISEIGSEIEALGEIKKALSNLLLALPPSKSNNLDLLDDEKLLRIVESLPSSEKKLKENKNMENLEKANERLDKINDVRIIFVPASTVAASHWIGENPEDNAARQLAEFIKKTKLTEIKRDFRIFGFNNPCPKREGETYGYEFYVTIPDELEVKAPLVKKNFSGGLYAAHAIKMGDFHEWKPFYRFVLDSGEYEIDCREPLGMDGALEEELNAYSKHTCCGSRIDQLDLLIPIKIKK
ncbi:MAG: effector binding domain-containing protein [Clostridia bacterium]|nr:effector binding domain-containing protein [Clostridia bacterium]